MHKSMDEHVTFYETRRKSRKIFRQFLRIMCCVVAFVTTYALILPAITLEKQTFCGEEEHTHSESCYLLQTQTLELDCNAAAQLHVHSSACYHENGCVICGNADYLVHSHGAECRNADGELVCTLPERTQHEHGSDCYAASEPQLHVHSEACTVDVKGALICTQEVREGHKHTDACYRTTEQLLCTKATGHQHTEACYAPQLICTRSTQPHSHSEECYSIGAQICNIPENHVHQDGCTESYLICELPESEHVHDALCDDSCTQGHVHGDACYSFRTVCTVQEGHTHGASCYEWNLSCGKAEGEVHNHTEVCYASQKLLVCTLDENHVHDDSCYDRELTCRIPESEGHAHGDDCYEWLQEYDCGMEEGREEPVYEILVCNEPAAAVHVHGEDCFRILLTEEEPVCGEEHEHSYTCYRLICELPEHTHSLQCYSDPTADIESRSQWEATMKDVELTGIWDLDVIAIAESQLGYEESTRNYTVSEDETIHGYTRYGDWYGVPNGDWCAMFASFCLRYAGVETVPIHSGVCAWIEKLSEPETDLYRTAEEYTPVSGDLVFFDWDGDDLSDHVGLVYEITEPTEYKKAKLKTIEGNSSNRVQFVTYDLDSPELLGYCMLPENPDLDKNCNLEKHVHNKRDCYEEEILICEKAVHIHGMDCIATEPDAPAEPVYYCGVEAHEHDEACYDSEGNAICQKIWHCHEDSCLTEPVPEQTDSTEPATEPVYYCGMDVHTHDQTACYDLEGNLICQLPEHQHEERCTWVPVKAPAQITCYCGQEEHTHTDDCLDAAGSVICGIQEHTHNSVCLTDLSDLDPESRDKVENVIGLIDRIPSAEELMAKSEELAEAGDMDAEEQWMTETYQKIGLAYAEYVSLTEAQQSRVINRDKLLELDFVWSQLPLATYHVWLDGTNGGMMSLYGADNTRYTLTTAQDAYQFTLPATWNGPTKYAYTLRGWYDIYSRTYYRPGETVDITRSTVFYADWEAASYNIGRFNANVVDTVSTSEFVTTRMFDYSGIFNMYSSSLHSNYVDGNSHAESWNAMPKGAQHADGSSSLGIILRDWDTNGSKQNSYPSNFNDTNYPQFNTSDYVTEGLYYYYNMYDLFFNPNSNYMGISYLGTADHLFQYEKDPNSQYYGYYFYDSARNAASYNQSTGRFYVYDYLERTTTSKDNSKDSDFLPFNSPYVNNPSNHSPASEESSSGQRIYTYSSTDGNSGMTGTNFWFGMSTEIRFYLHNLPGEMDEFGNFGNQSLYGQDMEFRFSGDDDVYVLVDNSLILDIGGIHDIKSGSINFATGIVTVEGEEKVDKTAIIKNMEPGEHTLTLLYMERGSSMSNCSIYFNIVPRFTLALQKEDLLSNDLLDGAQFQVFMDENCTVPATLWPSYQDYKNQKENTTNTITVQDGYSSIWGFAAGNTYYIRETKPPGGQGYLLPNGLIKMELSSKGIASYTVMVIPDPNATGEAPNPTPGFQVEGFRIDEENHVAHLIVNNTVAEGETTDVLVRKVWEGTETKPVTVYLNADGKRIQEVTLSDENKWQYIWENLPKYQQTPSAGDEQPELTEIIYSVEEGVISGYVGTIETFTDNIVKTASWEHVGSFTTNETYLLYSNVGYLATTGNGGLAWVSEGTAKESPSAQWKVISLNGTDISLKNEAGYYLCNQFVGYQDGESYFYGSTEPGSVVFTDNRFREPGSYYRYLHSTIDANGRIPAKYDNYNAVQFVLYRRTVEETVTAFEGIGFKITNRPVADENQTSLTVTKIWTDRDGVTPFANQQLYETASVPVKLQVRTAGNEQYVDTGQTAALSLRTQWKHTFTALPIKNTDGEELEYTVVEDMESDDWTPQIQVTKASDGTFHAEVNNVYSRTVSIPVQKVWDSSIPDFEAPPVTIWLYSVKLEDGQVQPVESIVLNEANHWQARFTAIPPEEAGVRYVLYEKAQGFTAVYTHTDTVFIDGQRVRVGLVTFDEDTGQAVPNVVTNYVMQELPETGGPGTTLYTAGGILLMMAVPVLLYNKKYKRRRGGP